MRVPAYDSKQLANYAHPLSLQSRANLRALRVPRERKNMEKKQQKRQTIIPALNFIFLALAIAMVIWPKYIESRQIAKGKVELSACRQNIKALQDIIDTYRRTHNNMLPPNLKCLTLGKKRALEELPKCPASKALYNTYEKGYKLVQTTPFKAGVYTLSCYGHNHEILNLKKDEPYHSSIKGTHPTDSELARRDKDDSKDEVKADTKGDTSKDKDNAKNDDKGKQGDKGKGDQKAKK